MLKIFCFDQDAFFLVKFWADLNTNISDESSAFYGVTTT